MKNNMIKLAAIGFAIVCLLTAPFSTSAEATLERGQEVAFGLPHDRWI